MDSAPATTTTSSLNTPAVTVLPTGTATHSSPITPQPQPLTTYSDIPQRFSVDYPATWVQNVDVVRGVRFNSVGGASTMSVELVTSTDISDTMLYARRDIVAVAEMFPGYKELDLSKVAEHPEIAVLSFIAASGPTSAGGNHFLNGERYYLRLNDGRIALLTLLQQNVSYDKDLGRRVALTLKSIR